jgi:hypothetical protein
VKRIVLIAGLLLCGVPNAQADNAVYNNITKIPRGDDALQVDTSTCDQRLGAPKNGRPTSRQYKQCMRAVRENKGPSSRP